MKLLLSLGLTIVLAASALADPQCHTSELMQCIDIVVNWAHTLPKRSLPTTEEEVVVECEAFNKALNCALKFRDNCVTPLQKEVLGLVVEGAIEFVNDFCTPGSNTRKNYLKHAQCLNQVSQSDGVKEQIEYILAIVENMKNQDDKNLIMYSCCGYRKVHSWFLKTGIDTCGNEAVQPVLDMIHLVASQLPDVLCNGMDGSEDRCTALLPAVGSKISAEAKQSALFTFLRNALKNWLE
ncbi:uncharacterized protein TNCT_248441 [Trichonephila clavata]|uniref:Uncharacterized protein n=1 Tax=Trichonephila clavata TaxID=2740835 RepID=A0A8X6GI81_TRICU|nr:uncharacterized protein TNCT_248441 [Trichonephila clavata]